VFACEEVLLRTRAEAEQRNLTRERAYIDAELKHKQMEISENSEIEKQRIEADMRTQISHNEAMERREAEFMVKKSKRKRICYQILVCSCAIREGTGRGKTEKFEVGVRG